MAFVFLVQEHQSSPSGCRRKMGQHWRSLLAMIGYVAVKGRDGLVHEVVGELDEAAVGLKARNLMAHSTAEKAYSRWSKDPDRNQRPMADS